MAQGRAHIDSPEVIRDFRNHVVKFETLSRHAISGIQSDNVWLDVVGNNISNVNTLAYKSSRLEFADQFSQTLSGAFGGNTAGRSGGINPVQVGLGTRVASVQTQFIQGPTFATENATDICIQGDGFLAAKNGSQTYLTRAWNLTFESGSDSARRLSMVTDSLSPPLQ